MGDTSRLAKKPLTASQYGQKYTKYVNELVKMMPPHLRATPPGQWSPREQQMVYGQVNSTMGPPPPGWKAPPGWKK